MTEMHCCRVRISSRWGAAAAHSPSSLDLFVAYESPAVMSEGFSNPYAGDADFQYLALDRKKMLEEAPPYDAKTSCWIPDAKLGYIRSNIQSTKGDDVVVLTEAGEVRPITFFLHVPCRILLCMLFQHFLLSSSAFIRCIFSNFERTVLMQCQYVDVIAVWACNCIQFWGTGIMCWDKAEKNNKRWGGDSWRIDLH